MDEAATTEGAHQMTDRESASTQSAAPRKPYDTPVLTRYGTVEELTQTGPFQNCTSLDPTSKIGCA
jgi:hypothetical protein